MLYRTIQKSDTYLPGWLAEKTWCEYIWAINAEQRCERTFIDATLANDLVQNVRACEFKTCEALKQQLPHCAHQTNCLTLISTPDFVPRVQTQAVSQLKCHIENSNKINCDYEPSISLGRALGVHAKVIELLHFAPQLMTSACTTENCHLDWNLTDFTEILKRNIDCHTQKSLQCLHSHFFPTPLQKLRSSYAILCRVNFFFAFSVHHSVI